MLLTLTGNLLAERTFTFSQWSPGQTQRAQEERFQVGGKGINVAKMLHRIGAATTAWCFAGGSAGRECAEWLAAHGIPHRVFPTTSATRTGLVVRGGGTPETTFLAPDRAVDPAALDACAAALDAVPSGSAALALCGSFPGWDAEPAANLRGALERWAQTGPLIVDSYGPPLLWAIGRQCSLVKINREEFDTLFSAVERGAPVLERLATALKRWPVQRWVITDGPREICYAAADTPPASLRPPTVTEVSPTGSGDVFLACVLHALHDRGVGLADAVKFAIPYAAANAAHPGVAEFDLNLIPRERSVHL